MPGSDTDMVRWSEHDVASVADADARAVLTTDGLPRDHLLFGAEVDVTASASADGRRLLRLGDAGFGDGLHLDVDTGEVVVVSAQDGTIWHVNASVRQFAASLTWFAAHYPFYPANAEQDVHEAAVDMVRQALVDIDATALREDPGYWYTILFDIGIGDYSDEAAALE